VSRMSAISDISTTQAYLHTELALALGTPSCRICREPLSHISVPSGMTINGRSDVFPCW